MSIFRNLTATEFFQVKLQKMVSKNQFNSWLPNTFNYSSVYLQKTQKLQLK